MVPEWRSEADREKYLTLYRELRAEAGFADKERDVPTSAGTTRVFEWPGAGVPIVFLHGAGTNALMWAPVIDELTGRRRVAFDMPGDPGESVLDHRIEDVDGLVAWLDDVLRAAEVERSHLVAASYGAWLAVSAAPALAGRIASLTLVEPILDPLSARFWLHGIASGVAISLPGPQRPVLARWLHVGSVASNPTVRKLAVVGFRAHNRKSLPPPALPVPDEALAELAAPTQVLLAAHSSVHRANALAKRFADASPTIKVHVVPKSGHTLPVEHPAIVAEQVAAFTARTAPADEPAIPGHRSGPV
jgi:pimeloyl-ACP methyl ester carboxylesterase